MKTSAQIKEEVAQIFTTFLQQKELRKTPERYAILDEVYDSQEHFDVEQLYLKMKNKRYRVSRATVYNTLGLLVEANLVVRHQFGGSMALYERSFGYRQHDHLICLDCNRVTEFCDPRIGAIQSMIGNLLEFSISHHSLMFYGHCKREGCEHKPTQPLAKALPQDLTPTV